MPEIDPNVFALADNPNTYTPLGRGDERIVDPRFVLWMGGDGGDVKWSVAQRFRFDRGELDEVIADVHDLLRERGRDRCSWEGGSAASAGAIAAHGRSAAPRGRRGCRSSCWPVAWCGTTIRCR